MCKFSNGGNGCRSWVEDEAQKNQARAKVLEEVGRRWKWDSDAQMS